MLIPPENIQKQHQLRAKYKMTKNMSIFHINVEHHKQILLKRTVFLIIILI